MSPAAWGPAPPAWLLLPRRVPRVFLSSTTSCPEPTARGWGAVRSCPQAPPQAPPPSARPPPGLPLPRETVTTLCQHERPVCGFEGKKKERKKICVERRGADGVLRKEGVNGPRGEPPRGGRPAPGPRPEHLHPAALRRGPQWQRQTPQRARSSQTWSVAWLLFLCVARIWATLQMVAQVPT